MVVELPEILNSGIVIVLPESETKGEIVYLPVIGQSPYRIGDVLLFNKEPVNEVEINDVVHRLVMERDILGWYTRLSRDAPPSV